MSTDYEVLLGLSDQPVEKVPGGPDKSGHWSRQGTFGSDFQARFTFGLGSKSSGLTGLLTARVLFNGGAIVIAAICIFVATVTRHRKESKSLEAEHTE